MTRNEFDSLTDGSSVYFHRTGTPGIVCKIPGQSKFSICWLDGEVAELDATKQRDIDWALQCVQISLLNLPVKN